MWPKWQPSEHMRHFTEEQITKVRVTLNVDVEISPQILAASAPIESFEDMNLHPNVMKDIFFIVTLLLLPFKHKLFMWLSLVVIY
jgi:ATP-dependent RNA helicase DDX5/DBP2